MSNEFKKLYTVERKEHSEHKLNQSTKYITRLPSQAVKYRTIDPIRHDSKCIQFTVNPNDGDIIKDFRLRGGLRLAVEMEINNLVPALGSDIFVSTQDFSSAPYALHQLIDRIEMRVGTEIITTRLDGVVNELLAIKDCSVHNHKKKQTPHPSMLPLYGVANDSQGTLNNSMSGFNDSTQDQFGNSCYPVVYTDSAGATLNSTFTVTSSNNSIRWLTEGLTTKTSTIPVGSYTAGGLAEAVEDILDIDEDGANDYTVAYSTTDGKLTISGDTGNFNLLFADALTTCASLLGFGEANLVGAQTYTADNPIGTYDGKLSDGAVAVPVIISNGRPVRTGAITEYAVYVRFDSFERLLAEPLNELFQCRSNSESGLFNFKQLHISIYLKSDARNCITLSGTGTTQSTPTSVRLMEIVSPQLTYKTYSIPNSTNSFAPLPPCVKKYHDFDIYKKTNSNSLASGNSTTTEARIDPKVIPRYWMIYAKPSQASKELVHNDFNLAITNLSITYSEKSHILSDCPAEVLYEMSARNNLSIDYTAFTGTINVNKNAPSANRDVLGMGSIIVLDTQKDIDFGFNKKQLTAGVLSDVWHIKATVVNPTSNRVPINSQRGLTAGDGNPVLSHDLVCVAINEKYFGMYRNEARTKDKLL